MKTEKSNKNDIQGALSLSSGMATDQVSIRSGQYPHPDKKKNAMGFGPGFRSKSSLYITTHTQTE